MIYKCVVSYDGSAYSGWQIQPNCPSIQEQIEKALSKIHESRIMIVGSGRTDAAVHALGQVFHFESDKRLNEEQWIQALNRLLPRDIRILSVQLAKDDFHARFSAISKRYDYYITSDVLNPFLQKYMARDNRILDVEQMREAATCFLGTHDFTSFTSTKIDPRKTRIKTMTRLEIIQHEKHIQMIFEGDGFLRYMVRMMAQTLIEVGLGHLPANEVKAMLEAKDKHVCHYKAEACGLYLMKVNYREDEE